MGVHGLVPFEPVRLLVLSKRPLRDLDRQIDQLIEALDSDLEWRDAHARSSVRAHEWMRGGRRNEFLLRGSDLESAERWLASQGSHREVATADQADYILSSRKAATRRQRLLLTAVAIALGVSLGVTFFALVQRERAIQREKVAHSRELAARALAVLATEPAQSVRLAVEAVAARHTTQAEDALRGALAASHERLILRGHDGSVNSAAFGPDGERVVTAGDDGTARVWDAASGKTLVVMGGHRGAVHDAGFDPKGKRVVTGGYDGTARVWDAASGKP